MAGPRLKLLVVEASEQSRIKLCTWLSQDGYSVFECKDAYKALRLTRQVRPDLVLLNSFIEGINSKQLIDIIESEKLSCVFLMTAQENDEFRQLLQFTQLKMGIKKPIERKQFMAKLEEAVVVLKEQRLEALLRLRSEHSQTDAQVIEEAKCLLMEKWKISEADAYAYIRKMSMNLCLAKGVFAKDFLKRHKK